ncbi:MAG: efflux RND transporter permease subunit [Capsulimonadales bacterium]|nr:efflux RND transporter permease subunit [Capsulimonadales bacterium]
MNIAQFSVTRPVAVTMRIAALVLLGAVCFTRLPVDLLPNVSLPTVAVNCEWPNVAPEEIEAQVTRPLERAVSSVPGLYEVSSTTSEGNVFVRVQFQWGTNIGQAAVDVLQQVQRAKRTFPIDPTLTEPVVFKFDPSQTPILVYGVSGEKDVIKLRTLLDNEVAPILESANGVAAVNVTGGEQRAIIVDVDPDRLRARGLSLKQVSDRIIQENLNLPAGIAKQSETEYIVRSTGLFTSIDDMKRIPVASLNGATVTLGEIANVRDAATETRIYTRLNGEPSVGLLIQRQSGANTIATAEEVHKKLEEAKKLYPHLQFRLSYDQSRFIENSVDRVKEDGIIGATLAVLILLFFLRNVRSTLVVALSIPISVISTFTLLYVCGFTLNTMSLSGLALAIGLIVDDAVVVLENIFRHIERDGKRAAEAAVTGAQEIMTAVVASTVTIMIVFLPLLLIQGQSGQMFTQLALVVIFSIAVSLLDATTVVPMLASRLIRAEDYQEHGEKDRTEEAPPVGSDALRLSGRRTGRANGIPAPSSGDRSSVAPRRGNPLERFFRWSGERFDAMDRGYRHALHWSLNHRWWVVIGAFGSCALSLLLIPLIGVELMPATDSGDFQLFLKMPVGTSLAKTDETMRSVEKTLLEDPAVATVFAAAGTSLSVRGTSTSLNPNQGSALVKLKDERETKTVDVIARLRRKFSQIPGARITLNQFDLVTQILTGGTQNVEVNIFGEDLNELSRLSREVLAKGREISGWENLDVNWQDTTPELQWKVDRDKASQLGLSFSDIANSIGTATNGTISSYYQENGFQYPIYVQVPVDRRKTVESLSELPLRTASGTIVNLGQVATPEFGTGPSQITRLNRQRYIAVTGTPEKRSAGEIQEDITRSLQDWSLPAGYRWDWGSNQKRKGQEFAGMGLAVFLAIALIYMLLASQFESFIHPLTILLTVPLSTLGVILALFLSGRPFGLTAFIGLLLLVGIVVKNGILLIDYTNLLRERGRSRDDAILEASPTRLRPILMTSLAAGFGMLPLALGLGEGSETQAPLATAVVGGLTTSTILTLFVVPVVYTLFDDLARRFRGDRRDLARAPLVEPSVESVEAERETAGRV